MAEEPEDPRTAGGSTGEPETPVAASSPSDQELLASLEPGKEAASDPKAELWKQLESVDPRELPENIRQKLEAPFLSQFNKKTTELDQQRKQDTERLLEIVDRITRKGADPQEAVDQKELLRQKMAEGDIDAVESLMENIFQSRYGPQMTYISNKQAIETAAQLMPDLPKYEQQVADALRQDPNLLRLATIENRRFAPQVLAGLAFQQAYLAEQKANVDLKATIESEKRAAVEAYKNQLKSLPATTSRAGVTQGAPAEKPLGLTDAMERAWVEAGGS